jgi:phage-related protein
MGEMIMFQVELYQKTNGEVPLEIYLRTLPPKFTAKHQREFDLLMEFGFDLKEPHVKRIVGAENKGLYELRIHFLSNISRVFYFVTSSNVFVLLHGFIKKSQETLIQEIKKALKYKSDYERRMKNDQRT